MDQQSDRQAMMSLRAAAQDDGGGGPGERSEADVQAQANGPRDSASALPANDAPASLDPDADDPVDAGVPPQADDLVDLEPDWTPEEDTTLAAARMPEPEPEPTEPWPRSTTVPPGVKTSAEQQDMAPSGSSAADNEADQGESSAAASRRQTAAPAQAQPMRAAARIVTIYVDADNQLPNCAHALLRMLQEDLMLGPVRAVVAGNNCNGRLDGWCAEIRWTAPTILLERIQVPARKQAADVALIMALGANLAEHVSRRDLIVVVSRDESLIGAVEWAKAQGVGCLTAHGNGTPPASPEAPLPTLVLPVLERNECPPPLRTKPPSNPTSAPALKLPPTPSFDRPAATTAAELAAPGSTPEEVLQALREQCPPARNGGYSAGVVGHVLAKLGLDAQQRRAFLAQTPGIRVEGKGQDKRYLF